MLNIKEGLLLIPLIVYFPLLFSCLSNSKFSRVFFYGFIFPTFLILLSCTVGDTSINDAVSNGYIWLYLLLIPIIVLDNVNIKTPFLAATYVIAILIVSTWLLDLFGILSISQNPVVNYFNGIGEMQTLSKGVLATFGYAIYYKSSVLLVFSLGYYVSEKKYVRSALFLVALFMTGSRANAILALLMCTIILIINEKSKSSKILATILVLICTAMILPSFIEKIQNVTTLKYNRSEIIKLAGIQSTFNLMNSNKWMYIFGSGLGSYYYDSARGMLVQLFELSFIDFFRQVGLMGYIPFIYFLICPMKYLFQNNKWLLISYISYLIIAGTNPLLVNSTSFIGYLLIFTCAFEDERHSIL